MLRRFNETIKRWPLWDTLDYLQKLSIIVAIGLFFVDVYINNQKRHDERIQKHLQAWQIVNLGRTGDWGGGADGRVEALESLIADKVPLDGVDLTQAWLVGAKLRGASFRGASFDRAVVDLVDLRGGDLTGTDLSVTSANGLNIFGVRGVSPDLVRRLKAMGAVEFEGNRRWNAYRDSLQSESDLWRIRTR